MTLVDTVDLDDAPTAPDAGPFHDIDLRPGAAGDAALVQRILDGDRPAMAELYDRYADRVHTMCLHMLRDPDEAADATGQVLVTALQRLHQLREPAKLRSWLYAIARNEVFARTRHRSRVRPTYQVDDMTLTLDPTTVTRDLLEPGAVDDDDTPVPTADPEVLAALVQLAAGGLDDRDRMVLELNIAQGLDGTELADALGVNLDNAYQLTHRMKERFERSMAALLVVRAGRDLCPDLDGVAKKWDGNYDVLWRKRFARHVDSCPRCQKMRSKLPKAMLAGVALSQAAQAAVLAAPISVREAVLGFDITVVASEAGSPWSPSGFPRSGIRPRRWPQLGAAAAVAVAVTLGLAGSLDRAERGDEVVATGTTPAPATTTSTPAATPTSVPATATGEEEGAVSTGATSESAGTASGASTTTVAPSGRTSTAGGTTTGTATAGTASTGTATAGTARGGTPSGGGTTSGATPPSSGSATGTSSSGGSSSGSGTTTGQTGTGTQGATAPQTPTPPEPKLPDPPKLPPAPKLADPPKLVPPTVVPPTIITVGPAPTGTGSPTVKGGTTTQSLSSGSVTTSGAETVVP